MVRRKSLGILLVVCLSFIFLFSFADALNNLSVSSNVTNGTTWLKGGSTYAFNFTVIISGLNSSTNITQINISNVNVTLNNTQPIINATDWTCDASNTTTVNCSGNSPSIAINITIYATMSSSYEMNHSWIIVSADNFSGSNTTLWKIAVDAVNPTVTLPEYANATLNKNTDALTLNVSVTDSGSGGSYCSINVNGTNQTFAVSDGWCNSTAINLTNLTDGNNTIRIYANDSVENTALNNSFVVWIDTTAPRVYQGTNPVGYLNSSYENITFDIKCSDNYNASYIQLWGNWSGTWKANYTNYSYTNNTWINITVTGIPQGSNHKWAVWCNDTLGNSNITANRTFLVDTAKPIIVLDSPEAGVEVSAGANDFVYNVSDNFNIKNCSLYLNDYVVNTSSSITNNTEETLSATLSAGASYGWFIGCYDYSGNSNVSETTRYVVVRTGSNGGGGGGGSGSIVSEWVKEIKLNDSDLNLGQTLKELKKGYRATFNVKGVGHYLGVKNMTNTIVIIEIASTPQIATMSVGETKKFDVDDDNYYDLSVTLNSILNNKVDITLKTISEQIISDVVTPASSEEINPNEPVQEQKDETGNQPEPGQGVPFNYLWIIIPAVLIIAVILIIIFSRKK